MFDLDNKETSAVAVVDEWVRVGTDSTNQD